MRSHGRLLRKHHSVSRTFPPPKASPRLPQSRGETVAYQGEIHEGNDGYLFQCRLSGQLIDLEDFVPQNELIGPTVWLVRYERGDGWTDIEGIYALREGELWDRDVLKADTGKGGRLRFRWKRR